VPDEGQSLWLWRSNAVSVPQDSSIGCVALGTKWIGHSEVDKVSIHAVLLGKGERPGEISGPAANLLSKKAEQVPAGVRLGSGCAAGRTALQYPKVLPALLKVGDQQRATGKRPSARMCALRGPCAACPLGLFVLVDGQSLWLWRSNAASMPQHSPIGCVALSLNRWGCWCPENRVVSNRCQRGESGNRPISV
jgi:hypothetical protein